MYLFLILLFRVLQELDLLSLSAISGDANSVNSSEGICSWFSVLVLGFDVFAAMSRDDETQRCETDALYRMLSERPASWDASADSAAAAAVRDAEFDRTQRDVASLQLQVLPSSQRSDSGRYCTSEGAQPRRFCPTGIQLNVLCTGPLGHVDFRQPGDSKVNKGASQMSFRV